MSSAVDPISGGPTEAFSIPRHLRCPPHGGRGSSRGRMPATGPMTTVTPMSAIKAAFRRAFRSVDRFDIVIATSVALMGQLEVWGPDVGIAVTVGPAPVNAAGYLLASLALIWRRAAPVAVFAFIATVSSLQYVVAGASQGFGSFLPPFLAFYAVGRYAQPQVLMVAVPLAVLGTAVHELRDPNFEFGGTAITYWIVFATAWPLGYAFRRRELHAQVLTDRTERLEAERDKRAQIAVAEERARLARELHDVVGHGVSVIVVQSVAAAGSIEAGDTDSARRRLGAIEETARQSLMEMRRLVGLLDESVDAQFEPQPSIAAIEPLLHQVREAGLPVKLEVQGQPRPLSPGVDLVAYRIVQEALTNTLKHAGPTHALVTIRYAPDALDVEVIDHGRGRNVGGDDGGRGHLGMRERVRLFGGFLEVGPAEGTGYRVRAVLPISEPGA